MKRADFLSLIVYAFISEKNQNLIISLQFISIRQSVRQFSGMTRLLLQTWMPARLKTCWTNNVQDLSWPRGESVCFWGGRLGSKSTSGKTNKFKFVFSIT